MTYTKQTYPRSESRSVIRSAYIPTPFSFFQSHIISSHHKFPLPHFRHGRMRCSTCIPELPSSLITFNFESHKLQHNTKTSWEYTQCWRHCSSRYKITSQWTNISSYSGSSTTTYLSPTMNSKVAVLKSMQHVSLSSHHPDQKNNPKSRIYFIPNMDTLQGWSPQIHCIKRC